MVNSNVVDSNCAAVNSSIKFLVMVSCSFETAASIKSHTIYRRFAKCRKIVCASISHVGIRKLLRIPSASNTISTRASILIDKTFPLLL